MISLLACKLLHSHLFLTAWKLCKGRYLTVKLLCYNIIWQNIPTERNRWKAACASPSLNGKGLSVIPQSYFSMSCQASYIKPNIQIASPIKIIRAAQPVRERSAHCPLMAACSKRSINHSPHQRRPRWREGAAGNPHPFLI